MSSIFGQNLSKNFKIVKKTGAKKIFAPKISRNITTDTGNNFDLEYNGVVRLLVIQGVVFAIL